MTGPVLSDRPSPVTIAVGVRVKLTSRGTKPPSLADRDHDVVGAGGEVVGDLRDARRGRRRRDRGRRHRRDRRQRRRRLGLGAGRAVVTAGDDGDRQRGQDGQRRGCGSVRRMTVRRSRGPARFPGHRLRAVQPVTGVVQHYPWGDHRVHPRPARRRARRAAVGRALARHPPQRPGHAGRRPPAGRRDRSAPLPAQGARRRRAAVAAGPPVAPSRPQAGFAAGRYPDPEPKPELLLALTPFDAFCGIRPVDATLELLGEHRRRRPGRRRAPPRPGAARSTELYRGLLARRADRRRRGDQRPARGGVGRRGWPSATPATPAWRSRCCSTSSTSSPARRSSSGPGNLHAYLGGAGIELMGASDNVVRGGLTTQGRRRRRPPGRRSTRRRSPSR